MQKVRPKVVLLLLLPLLFFVFWFSLGSQAATAKKRRNGIDLCLPKDQK